jgi:hypothetical protein
VRGTPGGSSQQKVVAASQHAVIEKLRKSKVTKKQKTTDTKVFRKPLCGQMQRYKLQHAMKICFEVNFRFFDCCRHKVLGGTVDMKTKVSRSLCQTGLLANNVPAASQRSLA